MTVIQSKVQAFQKVAQKWGMSEKKAITRVGMSSDGHIDMTS